MAERIFAVARTEDLIVQEMGPETLVFDRRTDVAHNLSPIASIVWNLCDGKHDVDALVAAVAEIEPTDAQAATDAALTQLGEQGLLVDGVSRRGAVKKMAKFGAGAFTAPLLVSVLAPAAAMAVSNKANGTSCTADGECLSGHCVTGTGTGASGKYCSYSASSPCTIPGVKPSVGNCNASNGTTGTPNQTFCCTNTCNATTQQVCG